MVIESGHDSEYDSCDLGASMGEDRKEWKRTSSQGMHWRMNRVDKNA